MSMILSDQTLPLSKSCQLLCIRPYLDVDTAKPIATIVHAKLDYYNSLYHHFPTYQITLSRLISDHVHSRANWPVLWLTSLAQDLNAIHCKPRNCNNAKAYCNSRWKKRQIRTISQLTGKLWAVFIITQYSYEDHFGAAFCDSAFWNCQTDACRSTTTTNHHIKSKIRSNCTLHQKSN